MAVGLFNYHSRRAKYARLAATLSVWQIAFAIIAVLLLLSGIGLLFLGWAVGWLLIGLVAPFIMVIEWYNYELRTLTRVENGQSVDDILDADILAHLPEQPSPQIIAEVIGQSRGGVFLAVRFGIVSSFLRDIASSGSGDSEAVFKESLAIAKQTGGRITASVLALALLRQVPERVRNTLLGHLQLEEDDLIRGIQWDNYNAGIRDRLKDRSSREGGVGRDWSFGWIPHLSRFGVNISRADAMPRPDLRTEPLRQLIESLGTGKEAIALVGKTGVGKTELVYELADVLMHPDDSVPKELRYRQVFLLSASRLLSTSQDRGAIETIVEELFSEALHAKNIIICFDNAELFLEEGPNSIDIVGTLVSLLEARRLPVILTLDEQRFLRVAKRAPELTATLRRINVQPTSESDTLKVLEDRIPGIEVKYNVAFMYQALKEAYKLGKRYVYDIAMPAQAVSLLEASAEYAEEGLVTLRSVNKAIEATTGVKTAKVDDESDRDMLLHLEERLHERVIGQNRAVTVIADALRRARAGIRNQNRPVGTFLFLGPTGVGKTELSKALAAIYFGGEQNIIRLDMNEFVSSDDVKRLIADGADNTNSLAAQVIKRPFSVVLLDEIEKAHSSVLTTLLQLLDEGVLRDERNREVSFRDTIVIATSNAGSDRIQEYLQRGYTLERFEEEFINELIGGHVFHPEFLNRFDEMVVFGPLDTAQLLQVVDHILADINTNLEAQKITVVVAQDAKEFLVQKGYDPRLGARPMRRVVQRAVESTVAKLLLGGDVTPGETIELTLEQIRPIIETKNQADAIIENSKKG